MDGGMDRGRERGRGRGEGGDLPNHTWHLGRSKVVVASSEFQKINGKPTERRKKKNLTVQLFPCIPVINNYCFA